MKIYLIGLMKRKLMINHANLKHLEIEIPILQIKSRFLIIS